MSLHTNLRGRLRNTSLPKNHGLMPVFEAVVNSIHSIEEKGNVTSGKITLTILRDTSQGEIEFDEKSSAPITGFRVSDDGCGFDHVNFESFQTLDSDHKITKGCRGVGRLLWLKAFESVDASSDFLERGHLKHRTFKFNDTDNVHDNVVTDSDRDNTGSSLTLNGFYEKYRNAVPNSSEKIANSLLEHCLWYFVRESGVPHIYVEDGEESYYLSQLYDGQMISGSKHETLSICDETFEITHIKFRSSVNKKHQLALCAANRLVKEEGIQGKLPGLYSKISDDNGEFIYTCYVSSTYLDENVRQERTSFDIAENFDGLFADDELSLKLIREKVLERTEAYLGDILESNVRAGKARIENYIADSAPRYRPITGYIDEEDLIIDPDKNDKDVELHLHERWYEVERKLLVEGHDILKPTVEVHTDEYKERVEGYLKMVEDLKKSDLANYVSHRKVIIELLEKSIKSNDDGKYAKEEVIHKLIMPMRKDSDEVFLDSCNLWLLDERLAFHHYLASDKTLKSMPITDSDSTKEPDLLAVNYYDRPILTSDDNLPKGSLTIVEIKRPMRNDAKEGEDKDPIQQALGYLKRIREGKVKTKDGRLIRNGVDLPAYCYIVADLTEKMVDRCEYADLIETHDHGGFFGYNKRHKAYIEVVSFDRLVEMAKQRNQAFFDKLGLPMS